jgi:glyoxylase-like metal-dependent hydrolase (beta-lactamase superfamily II)/8-oxo-dGTP pyrophosphatase MutT (NUDIX family)
MSELPAGIPPAVEPTPRDSASGVVLRAARGGGFEVLLGLRSRRSRFLPGHLACPGGAVEPRDRPHEPGAFERCASRELAEEAGIRIEPERWLAAGERVTPPMFPVRFHTRFFLATIPRDTLPPDPPPAPDEIESLRLARPATVLDEWAAGRALIPPPILPILRELAEAGGASPGELALRIARANAEEQRAPRIEFVPDLWVLPVRTATLPPATHTNVWMPGGTRFVIIDPGATDPAERQRLLDVVARRRDLRHEPLAIVLTHHHQDHVGGAADIASRLGLPLRAHPATLEALRARARIPAGLGTPLGDQDEIDLDGVRLRALHTPGHAEGHLAFEVVARGQLIAGDLVSSLSTILIDPEHGDMDAYLASLARVRDLGCRTLFPAHGAPLPARAVDELIEHRRERERRVLSRLGRNGVGLAEIAAGAYEDVDGIPVALAELQTRAHLAALERRGRVRRADALGRAWSLA